jgi:hypothetical protein
MGTEKTATVASDESVRMVQIPVSDSIETSFGLLEDDNDISLVGESETNSTMSASQV